MSDGFENLRNLIQQKALWAQIVVRYNTAITDLNTIINAVNPTNAQVIWAVQRLAQIQKDVLNFLKLMEMK